MRKFFGYLLNDVDSVVDRKLAISTDKASRC